MKNFAAWIAVLALVGCNQASATKDEGIEITYKPAATSNVVGKIGGKEITENDLISEDASELFELESRVFEFKDGKFRELVERQILEKAAQDAKMSVEDFINKKIINWDPAKDPQRAKSKVAVSEAEMKKFAEDRKIPADRVNELKDRIRDFLAEEKRRDLVTAFGAKEAKKQKLVVESFVAKPQRPTFDVKVREDAPMTAKATAKVNIVEFSDFQCPFCARGAATMDEVKKKYGSRVNIVFAHYPLAIHPEAAKASEASECAHEQKKFWAYHDILFKNQDKMKEADLMEHAKTAKLDTKKFEECLKSGRMAAKVKADMEQGERLKVRSTPTFFVNGQLVMGALPLEEFSKIIDEQLKK